ncbi:MAG: hypothetical protein HY673_04055 [Chloroflexi bacterium]|nr:hypothetical protein [Chloroflexota bacterium]
MISTVTTVTTTVTTTSVIAAANATMGLIAVLILLALLITRELTRTAQSKFSRTMADFISVGTVPLILIFVIIIAMKVVQIITG